MKRLSIGIVVSLACHALIFWGAEGLIAWQNRNASNSIDIDLSGSSLLMRPAMPGSSGRSALPQQPWILGLKGHVAPRPQAQAQPLTQVAEVEAGPACPAPCPEQAGDWVPAAATSRRPVWSEGLLTDDDYPQALRKKGTEGRVVAEVLIDATGTVRDVKLIQTSEAEFNQVVLEKLKQSKFRPAYDQEGNAVPCRLRLPLSFKLSN